MRTLYLATVLLSVPVLALEPGTTMYVKPVETVLLKAPRKGAKAVVKLQSNDEVIWNGPSPQDAKYQSVTTKNGKKGFLPLDELSETEIPFSQQGYTKDNWPK